MICKGKNYKGIFCKGFLGLPNSKFSWVPIFFIEEFEVFWRIGLEDDLDEQRGLILRYALTDSVRSCRLGVCLKYRIFEFGFYLYLNFKFGGLPL